MANARALAHAVKHRILPSRSVLRVVLPPRSARFCTTEWKDDRFYFSTALRDVFHLTQVAGLTENSRFLDIGCGQGRIAIGLQHLFPNLRSYDGVDVHAPSVEWCQRNLARQGFRFTRISSNNERYNPGGKAIIGQALPLPSSSFDLAFLYSVFTHMTLADVTVYLNELGRVLAPGGRVFLTVYVEKWDKPEDENPAGYLGELGEHSGPLHRVVFDRELFERLCKQASLNISKFEYRGESVTKQSSYVLERAA